MALKRIYISICLVLIFLVVYLLQVNFFSWFNIADVKPNLFVILVLAIGLFAGKSLGTAFGIFFGLNLDFFIGKSIGISAIMLGIIGFVGGYLDRNFSKDSRFTMLIMVEFATLIYELGICAFNYLVNDAMINTLCILKYLIIELIFNAMIAIIIYPLIIKFGYKIEENFKENRILTRYF